MTRSSRDDLPLEWIEEDSAPASSPRRRRPYPLLVAAAAGLLVGVVAVLPKGRPAISPTPTVVPATTTVTPLAVPVEVSRAGWPLMAVPSSWELIGRGAELVRIELGAGRVTRTAIPAVQSTGPVYLVAGLDRVVIRPLDFVPGYLVPDGHPAQPLTGLLGNGGPAFPGPDPSTSGLTSTPAAGARWSWLASTARPRAASPPASTPSPRPPTAPATCSSATTAGPTWPGLAGVTSYTAAAGGGRPLGWPAVRGGACKSSSPTGPPGGRVPSPPRAGQRPAALPGNHRTGRRHGGPGRGAPARCSTWSTWRRATTGRSGASPLLGTGTPWCGPGQPGAVLRRRRGSPAGRGPRRHARNGLGMPATEYSSLRVSVVTRHLWRSRCGGSVGGGGGGGGGAGGRGAGGARGGVRSASSVATEYASRHRSIRGAARRAPPGPPRATRARPGVSRMGE